MINKKLRKKIWGVMEKHGLWQDYKFKLMGKERRDELYRDMEKVIMEEISEYAKDIIPRA